MRLRDIPHILGVHKMDISRLAKARSVCFAPNWVNPFTDKPIASLLDVSKGRSLRLTLVLVGLMQNAKRSQLGSLVKICKPDTKFRKYYALRSFRACIH
jgi:hypothetical protein